MYVPRNYRNPTGKKFRLAVARVPAEGPPKQRLGSLFQNPGGPGNSGIETLGAFAEVMSPEIRARYDLVSWDPRVVGISRPAITGCTNPWPFRPARALSPNWQKIVSKFATMLSSANHKCQSRNRSIANWIGTNNVVRDLDTLRRGVGDRKLNYWGASYGSRIAYVYALRFPNRVGRMVLDGNVDPSSGGLEFVRRGSPARDTALGVIRSRFPDLYREIQSTIASLREVPLELLQNQWFSQWDYKDIIVDWMGSQDAWPQLQQINESVQVAPTQTPTGAAQRDVLASLIVTDNSDAGGASPMINCLDYAARTSVTTQSRMVAKIAKRAPIFGGTLGASYATGCDGFNLRSDPVPLIKSRNTRDRLAKLPIVVANATKDAATPMLWAQRMREAFRSSRLVSYSGAQHVIWGGPSTCVNEAINAYVLGGSPKAKNCPFVIPAGL